MSEYLKNLTPATHPQDELKTIVVPSVIYWAVTGTFHGSIVEAESEGEARRIFHKYYNGESIISVKKRNVLM